MRNYGLLNMIKKYGIAVIDGLKFRSMVELNRPFHPGYSSLFILKNGVLRFERQLETVELDSPDISLSVGTPYKDQVAVVSFCTLYGRE